METSNFYQPTENVSCWHRWRCVGGLIITETKVQVESPPYSQHNIA